MSNLVRQPFFQERVVSILRERNRDALKSMFKIQRFCNPAALVELRDGSKKLVVDTRMVRARDILDRAFRKRKSHSPDPMAEGDTKEEGLTGGRLGASNRPLCAPLSSYPHVARKRSPRVVPAFPALCVPALAVRLEKREGVSRSRSHALMGGYDNGNNRDDERNNRDDTGPSRCRPGSSLPPGLRYWQRGCAAVTESSRRCHATRRKRFPHSVPTILPMTPTKPRKRFPEADHIRGLTPLSGLKSPVRG